MKTKQTTAVEKMNEPKISIAGWIKERALKDLTNTLEVQPVKLKASRSGLGLKTNLSGMLKEVGPTVGWVSHGDKQNFNIAAKIRLVVGRHHGKALLRRNLQTPLHSTTEANP